MLRGCDRPNQLCDKVSACALASAVRRALAVSTTPWAVFAERPLKLKTLIAREKRFLTRWSISRRSNYSRSCARLLSEISRAIFEAPMISPLSFLIGDTVREISMRRPSFVSRIVS